MALIPVAKKNFQQYIYDCEMVIQIQYLLWVCSQISLLFSKVKTIRNSWLKKFSSSEFYVKNSFK